MFVNPYIQALQCTTPERVPFIPALYEYKAFLIGKTPSDVCTDGDLLFRSLLAEYETIRPDALVVGIDVYNVEAEALGCKVTYYGGGDTSIPGISPLNHKHPDEIRSTMHVLPNPLRDGRMPLHIRTAGRIQAELGPGIPVRGAVSGPFSLAVSLIGLETWFGLLMDDPEQLPPILEYCSNVLILYGRAFIDVGCTPILFDSQASPALISPAMYRKFVLPYHRHCIDEFRNYGVTHTPIIIGGNTTPILDDYLATGANNILCDSGSEPGVFLEKCSNLRRAFRRNLDSSVFTSSSPDSVYATASRFIKDSSGYSGFILGTGVVPYATPVEILRAVRQAALDASGSRCV